MQVGGWLQHLLSGLTEVSEQEPSLGTPSGSTQDATPSRVVLFLLSTLSDESRLALAAKVSQGALMASLFAALIAAQWPP